MRAIFRQGWKDAGAATVKLALSVPVLCLLLVSAADIARIFYLTIQVQQSAQAGVEYGTQSHDTCGDIEGMQDAALADRTDIPGLTATATEICKCADGKTFTCGATAPCSEPRTYVRVTTAATFTTVLSYPGIPRSMPLSSTRMARAF